MEEEPPDSRTSPHPALDPIPGSVLLDLEVARRDGLKRRGNLLSGCGEIDDSAMLGGFERGCVVGLSAEDEEIALLIGLQTIARLLARGQSPGSFPEPSAVIITTLPMTAVLPILRKVMIGQLQSDVIAAVELDARVRAMLEHVSISRVFDFEGLLEALGELGLPSELRLSKGEDRGAGAADVLGEAPPSGVKPPSEIQEEEEVIIQDSEEEGYASPILPGDEISAAAFPSDSSPQTTTPRLKVTTSAPKVSRSSSPPHRPDIVLITHLSSLLTSLFSRRDKHTAHATLHHLSSHLRSLARSPADGAPLFLLLNATTANTAAATTAPADPSLRSLFAPPGTPPCRPAFGRAFAQALDLHLLCARVPRSRADAEAVLAPRRARPPRFVWAVEVLLDEVGVWEEGTSGRGDGAGRRSRERRWGAVEVEEGVRVVDAFARPGV